MSPKKIALFADYLSGLGGTEFYIVQLASRLKEKGFDVKIFTGTKPKSNFWLDILKSKKIEVYYSKYEYTDREDRLPEQKFIPIIEKIFIKWSPDINIF